MLEVVLCVFVLVALAATGSWLWQSEQRTSRSLRGVCPECGYQWNAERCSECGYRVQRAVRREQPAPVLRISLSISVDPEQASVSPPSRDLVLDLKLGEPVSLHTRGVVITGCAEIA